MRSAPPARRPHRGNRWTTRPVLGLALRELHVCGLHGLGSAGMMIPATAPSRRPPRIPPGPRGGRSRRRWRGPPRSTRCCRPGPRPTSCPWPRRACCWSPDDVAHDAGLDARDRPGPAGDPDRLREVLAAVGPTQVRHQPGRQRVEGVLLGALEGHRVRVRGGRARGGRGGRRGARGQEGPHGGGGRRQDGGGAGGGHASTILVGR